MWILLMVAAGTALLLGLVVVGQAETIMQEIFGAIFWLIGAVMFCAAAIVDELRKCAGRVVQGLGTRFAGQPGRSMSDIACDRDADDAEEKAFRAWRNGQSGKGCYVAEWD